VTVKLFHLQERASDLACFWLNSEKNEELRYLEFCLATSQQEKKNLKLTLTEKKTTQRSQRGWKFDARGTKTLTEKHVRKERRKCIKKKGEATNNG